MICRLHLYSYLGPANVKCGLGGGGGSNGGGGSGNGSDNGNGDHSRAQQLLSEHLLYISQLHLTLVVFTINVTLPSLISFFTKHVWNASCGLRGHTKGRKYKNDHHVVTDSRSLLSPGRKHKRVSLITEEHATLG